MRRVAFAVMLLVTAWSFWAWAQPNPHPQFQTQRPPAMQQPHPGAPAMHPGGPALEGPASGEVRTAEGTEAQHEGAEAESEQPKPFNWTEFGGETPPYVAMLINFAILVTGYYFLGRKPIAAGLQSRRDTIAKDIEEAARMRREAEERAKVYQAKLEKLDEEVRTARDGLIRAGEAERDRIILDAEAKAERMQRDAEFLVEQELKQIRVDLLRDTVEAAVGAAEELLKKRVTAADQERLAEDYLSDLGGKKPVPAPAATGAGTNGTGSTQESLS